MAWIAVDWGTTNLRAWIMGADSKPLNTLSSLHGMAQLKSSEFEAALLALIGPYLSTGRLMPVICCGMVGSRQGWAEASYLSVPCPPPAGEIATQVPATDPRMAGT